MEEFFPNGSTTSRISTSSSCRILANAFHMHVYKHTMHKHVYTHTRHTITYTFQTQTMHKHVFTHTSHIYTFRTHTMLHKQSIDSIHIHELRIYHFGVSLGTRTSCFCRRLAPPRGSPPEALPIRSSAKSRRGGRKIAHLCTIGQPAGQILHFDLLLKLYLYNLAENRPF